MSSTLVIRRCRPRLRYPHNTRQAQNNFINFYKRQLSIPTVSFPVVEACPSPTCACRDTPQGLDIDQKLPLNNTIPTYTEQVIISTGKGDWPSRIEDDPNSALARELRGLLGKGGRYSDVSKPEVI